MGVPPPSPPLIALVSIHFFTPYFSFAIESYIYATDCTLGPLGMGWDGWLRQHKQHRLEGNKRQLQLHCPYSRGQMWSWPLLPLLQEERVRRRGLGRALWRQSCLPQRPRSRVLREELRPWLWPGRTRWPLGWLLHLLQEEVIGLELLIMMNLHWSNLKNKHKNSNDY